MISLLTTLGAIAFIAILIVLFEIGRQLRNRPVGLALMLFVFLVAILAVSGLAFGRDLGQWDTTSQQIRQWYQSLMQPDNPAVSCCGEADAYWADSYEVSKDGEYIAIITDERADEPLRRGHVDVGTRIVIPKNKLKYDQSNPTGHGIVFLSRGGYVWCYVAPGGV